VAIVTTRYDLPIAVVASRMFERWTQENFLRYMRQHVALDALVTDAVEPAAPERTIPNPKRKTIAKALTHSRAALTELEQTYDQQARVNPEAQRPTIRGFKIAQGKLSPQITALETTCHRLKARLAALPKRVPVKAVLEEAGIVERAPEATHLTDAIKMKIPYAETRAEAEQLKRGFQTWATKQGVAAAGRRLDGDWGHPRTTNVAELPFAAVRLRTAAAKRFKKGRTRRPSSGRRCWLRSRASVGSTRPNCCRTSPRVSRTSTGYGRSGATSRPPPDLVDTLVDKTSNMIGRTAIRSGGFEVPGVPRRRKRVREGNLMLRHVYDDPRFCCVANALTERGTRDPQLTTASVAIACREADTSGQDGRSTPAIPRAQDRWSR